MTYEHVIDRLLWFLLFFFNKAMYFSPFVTNALHIQLYLYNYSRHIAYGNVVIVAD